jgi:DNA-directed RNA polymerase subunit RPC12/RpoP
MPDPVGGREADKPPFAPMALDEDNKPVVVCEMCGSRNIDFCGWDIDKCLDCGHWRYR